MNQSRICATALLAVLISACTEKAINEPEAQLRPSDVIGVYDLVNVDGQPLSAQPGGRIRYQASQYAIAENGQFSYSATYDVCAVGACQTEIAAAAGNWLLTWDGKIYFDPQTGSAWVVDVDRTTITRCPPGSTCAPKLGYQKH